MDECLQELVCTLPTTPDIADAGLGSTSSPHSSSDFAFAAMDKIPLNYEASEGDTNKRVTSTLPQELMQCLENARFLHLATCIDNVPQLSLMNYTYLPSSPHSAAPVIVMTTNLASRKTTNIIANPNVSLLVHDWVSHRPHGSQRLSSSGGSPGPGHGHGSSLASFLFNLNSSAVSSISATIGGAARLAPTGSDEESFYVAKHLENNTFEDGTAISTTTTTTTANTSRFVAGEDVRVIVVEIKTVRISDFKGNVRDWDVVPVEAVNGAG